MKRSYNKIILLLLILFSSNVGSFAAQEILARVHLKNIYMADSNKLQFDLMLERTSDKWVGWANGTFQFVFDSTGYVIDSSLQSIDLVSGSSDLDVSPITGIIPTDNYLVTPRLIKNRFSITVAGPDEFKNIKLVSKNDTGIRIGTFIITSKNNSKLPIYLKWLDPLNYYQACAYKINNDSLLIPNVTIFQQNDNVEMNDERGYTVEYLADHEPELNTIAVEFKAEYIGMKRVLLTWRTIQEGRNRGFVLKRAFRRFGDQDPKILIYPEKIGDYGLPYTPNDSIIGMGNSKVGRPYSFNSDTIPYRGLDYCYELLWVNFYGDTISTGQYACVKIPNSVIVWAKPDQNPFSDKVTVSYEVLDDVYLTATVYDLKGRRLETIFENKLVRRKTYYGAEGGVIFDASYYSQQGLYDIILWAVPIDDPTIEYSSAVVKVQLVR